MSNPENPILEWASILMGNMIYLYNLIYT